MGELAEYQCKDCIFWKPLPPRSVLGEGQWGHCHRYAPRPAFDFSNHGFPFDETAHFPATRDTNFCGEMVAELG